MAGERHELGHDRDLGTHGDGSRQPAGWARRLLGEVPSDRGQTLQGTALGVGTEHEDVLPGLPEVPPLPEWPKDGDPFWDWLDENQDPNRY